MSRGAACSPARPSEPALGRAPALLAEPSLHMVRCGRSRPPEIGLLLAPLDQKHFCTRFFRRIDIVPITFSLRRGFGGSAGKGSSWRSTLACDVVHLIAACPLRWDQVSSLPCAGTPLLRDHVPKLPIQSPEFFRIQPISASRSAPKTSLYAMCSAPSLLSKW